MEPSTEQKTPIFTVSQLTHAIKQQLESSFPFVCLQGEVSNFRRQASGHLYFSLKDAHAQISAVMFRGNAAVLKTLPKDGDDVIVKGEINVYPPRGGYQIVVRELNQVGLGELLLKLEELKQKIHKRGWFSPAHKKSLPSFPRTIGIVTSPTGAVIQDILNILSRRFTGVHVIINPVKVQGEGAAEEIARAIEQFNQYALADVIIVGRGGGSIEDLWAFNEEIVAEAIFKSQCPIVAAVGHETDHCIAEYVADVRAPTPSAAAEIITTHHVEYQHHLRQLHRRLQQSIGLLTRQTRQRLLAIVKQPFFASPYALLGPWMQKLDDTRNAIDASTHWHLQQWLLRLEGLRRQALALNPITQITHYRQKLLQWEKSLNATINITQARHKERLINITAALNAIDPKNLLKKGYSIAFSEKDRSVIKSVHTLAKDEGVRLLFADGEALATIKELMPQ